MVLHALTLLAQDDNRPVSSDMSASDLLSSFKRADSQHSLCIDIPRTCKQLHELVSAIDDRRVTLQTSDEIEAYSRAPATFSPTRLDMRCTRPLSLDPILSLLQSTPDVTHLSYEETWRSYPTDTLPRCTAMPFRLFETISLLRNLEILVLGHGATYLMVDDLERLTEDLPNLCVLHIPIIPVQRRQRLDANPPVAVRPPPVFRKLKVLSIGSPTSLWIQTMQPLAATFSPQSFPVLERLALVGAYYSPVTMFDNVLARLTWLEALPSFSGLWGALRRCHEHDSDKPLLRHLDLHFGQNQRSFIGTFPHLRTVRVLDDIRSRQDLEARHSGLSELLHDVETLEAPDLRLVTLVLREDIPYDLPCIQSFGVRCSERDVTLDCVRPHVDE